MSTTPNPSTTVLAALTSIDTAVASLQTVMAGYPSTTAGLSNVHALVSAISTASTSLRSLVTTAGTPSPVTPAPVVPVTPVSPPPAPVAGSYTPLVSDTFVNYPTTADLQGAIATLAGGTGTGPVIYQSGALASLISLDPSVSYNGHPTMKFSMPGGQKNCPSLWANLPSAQDIIWFRTKIRFSPGFTTTGTTSGGNAFKLLAWGHDTYDGSGRLEIANTTQYQLYWNIQAKNTGTLVGGGQYAIDGNITSEWTDGGWYDYIIKVDRSKGTVASIAVWMAKDGSAPVSKASTTEAMLNGSAMPHVVSVGFAIEFNQVRAANQTQAIWIGQWEVVSGSTYPDPYGL